MSIGVLQGDAKLVLGYEQHKDVLLFLLFLFELLPSFEFSLR